MKDETIRFVLTYEMCDGDVIGCLGVYDDADQCLGAIFSEVLREMDGDDNRGIIFPEMEFRHDGSNDNYYEIIVRRKVGEDLERVDTDIYRVFYLREESK